MTYQDGDDIIDQDYDHETVWQSRDGRWVIEQTIVNYTCEDGSTGSYRADFSDGGYAINELNRHYDRFSDDAEDRQEWLPVDYDDAPEAVRKAFDKVAK